VGPRWRAPPQGRAAGGVLTPAAGGCRPHRALCRRCLLVHHPTAASSPRSRPAEAEPLPFLATEFVSANLWSMALYIGEVPEGASAGRPCPPPPARPLGAAPSWHHTLNPSSLVLSPQATPPTSSSRPPSTSLSLATQNGCSRRPSPPGPRRRSCCSSPTAARCRGASRCQTSRRATSSSTRSARRWGPPTSSRAWRCSRRRRRSSSRCGR
jgi:hypothetical protein